MALNVQFLVPCFTMPRKCRVVWKFVIFMFNSRLRLSNILMYLIYYLNFNVVLERVMEISIAYY